MVESWEPWRDILKASENFKGTITPEHVDATTHQGYAGKDLAKALWNFVSRFLGYELYTRREKIGWQIQGNGFEPWRRMFA